MKLNTKCVKLGNRMAHPASKPMPGDGAMTLEILWVEEFWLSTTAKTDKEFTSYDELDVSDLGVDGVVESNMSEPAIEHERRRTNGDSQVGFW